MVNELILHIGDAKTGSTAIQDVLVAKRFACKSQNIIFPSIGGAVA